MTQSQEIEYAKMKAGKETNSDIGVVLGIMYFIIIVSVVQFFA